MLSSIQSCRIGRTRGPRPSSSSRVVVEIAARTNLHASPWSFSLRPRPRTRLHGGVIGLVPPSYAQQQRGEDNEVSTSVDERSDETDENENENENENDEKKRGQSAVSRIVQAWLAPLQMMTKAVSMRTVRLALFVAVGALLSLLRRGAARSAPPPQEVLYSDFLNLCSTGNVKRVRFEQGSQRLLFDIDEASASGAGPAAASRARSARSASASATSASASATSATSASASSSSTKIPRQFYTRHLPDPNLIGTLRDNGISFGSVKPTFGAAMGKVLFTALALWIPLIPMFIIMRRFLDGRNGTSRAKKSKNKERAPRVRFADVAGVDVAKRELEEVVSCLRDGRKFTRVGAKLPSGVLLCGPPGTGKTLLAKAVAGEAGVPFLSVAASEFVELFVGRGAARIRELFAEARKRSPCVVFIDELDAIGGKRGAGLNEERDQTLNQLLTELDGFDGRPGVVLLAATNRPEVLDAALLRPGRLSRKVNVPLPDVDGRAAIMRVHLRNIPVEDEEFAATAVARLTGGMSGAELANCVNEAAFMAARREADVVSMDDLSEAILRTRFGVNGSAAEIPSWSKRLNNWLMANASPPRTMRSPPLGGGS